MITLANLEQAIRESWSLDTAEEDDGWTTDNPSRGQCDITALVVPVSGVDVDLTRDQFKRGEAIGEPRIGRRTPAIADPEHPRYHRYEAYLVLSERVRGRLGLPEWHRFAA